MQHDAIHARFAHIDRKWVRDAISNIEASKAQLKSIDHFLNIQKSAETEILRLCVEAEGRLQNLFEHFEVLEDYLNRRDRATTEAQRHEAVENYGYVFGKIIQEIRGFDAAMQKIAAQEEEFEKAQDKKVTDIHHIKDTISHLKKAQKEHIAQLLRDLKIDRSDFKKILSELDWG